ncbi:PHD finger protein ALFIN-LIKE 7-like isoform X1 [Mercurialis annua]|uniref:PHD finger protein ALFIN-LIKE 7-like isoform X1 n=1 Tax=Mercurialis annua TaxID=3986 RepID=UPI00215FC6D9|nr:PHD finger protein ALFIN-LIKE 7-like isoform X1 [Mercurialis annua]
MEGITHPVPRTVEEVFSDFKGRRSGLIKALFSNVEKFYQQCDPELSPKMYIPSTRLNLLFNYIQYLNATKTLICGRRMGNLHHSY